MARRTILICDRCNKETPTEEYTEVDYIQHYLNSYQDPLARSDKVEICKSCTREFIKWLKAASQEE